jgi:hypothetical protein
MAKRGKIEVHEYELLKEDIDQVLTNTLNLYDRVIYRARSSEAEKEALRTARNGLDTAFDAMDDLVDEMSEDED